MKMNLLQDIIKGLETLEKQQSPQISAEPKKTFDFSAPNMGKLLQVTRAPNVEPFDKYAEKYSSREAYNYDPESIRFFKIPHNSPEHYEKLNDLNIISKVDPNLCHKILTLG